MHLCWGCWQKLCKWGGYSPTLLPHPGFAPTISCKFLRAGARSLVQCVALGMSQCKDHADGACDQTRALRHQLRNEQNQQVRNPLCNNVQTFCGTIKQVSRQTEPSMFAKISPSFCPDTRCPGGSPTSSSRLSPREQPVPSLCAVHMSEVHVQHFSPRWGRTMPDTDSLQQSHVALHVQSTGQASKALQEPSTKQQKPHCWARPGVCHLFHQDTMLP
ncbi:hypothetical protein KIL84_000538 [Mauremys mutica]|uniref:Uncharacterized protein n=1 Tax=Mauremys mutica TaxID=74926 RepID=A0A9D3WYA5_9SAUR|nr:hypothetical protein KIL84_000538 [Mauremys mutica]